MNKRISQHCLAVLIAFGVLYAPLTIGDEGVDAGSSRSRVAVPPPAAAARAFEQPFKSPSMQPSARPSTQSAAHAVSANRGDASAAGADTQSPPAKTQQKWNLKNVDIRTVISRVSRETGKNFVIDSRVQGKVTLVSEAELSNDALYHVFLAMLQVNGFAAIESEGAIRIIREQDIRALTGPVTDFPQTHYADENVVSVVNVEHVPVKDLVSALKPLVPKTAHLTVYAPSNNVIIADRAENVSRLKHIISELDKPWTDSAEIIKLRHAAPTEIVNIIDGLHHTRGRVGGEAPISLAADDRTNSVIMSGPPSKRLQIRAMIARLDVESAYDGNIHVVYLKYTRARDLAPILANIIDSYQVQNAQTANSNRQIPNAARAGGFRGGVNRSDNLGAFSRLSPAGGGGGTRSLASLEAQNSQLFAGSEDREKSGGTGTVQWEETTNSVIVKAPPPLMKVLRSVIAKLDIRRPQVLVEAIIAEVDVDQIKSLGVEWNTNGDVRLRTRFPSSSLTSIVGPLGGSGQVSDPTGDILARTPGVGLSLGFFHHDNLRALVRAIAGDTRNNVLATPNIITLDNETANIKVGEQVPFLTGSTSNDQGTVTSVDRQEVGLSLTIRPQITQSGAIKMQINHVLSNVIDGSSATNPGNNPTTSERIITTNVVVDNGETLVLGGLIRSDWIKSNDRIPVLGNLPVIGKAFRSDEKRMIKRNLMVFIRPVILRDKNDNIEVTTDKYNHIRQMQIESYRDVPRYEESPALEQLDAPKKLPPPFHYTHVGYK